MTSKRTNKNKLTEQGGDIQGGLRNNGEMATVS